MRELIILLIIFTAQVCSDRLCKTNDEGPVKNASCVFPFKYREKTFNFCTDFDDAVGKLWCSTKVKQEGVHIKGNWGYCNLKGVFLHLLLIGFSKFMCHK